MSLLSFRDVSYTSNERTILKHISVDIDQGDFISIVGPSGSGKSTFLKLCAHLISPSGGLITFRTKPLGEYDPIELRRQVAYCFQTPYMFGDTVWENIAFPYEIRKMKVDMQRVKELFASLNLFEDYLSRETKNLSGGEKQRIALIRVLLFKPEILLLDEVTSALDSQSAAIVENLINSINQLGTTVLWITHNAEQSRKHANKLVSVVDGEISSLEELR